MKRKALYLYCITLFCFCQVLAPYSNVFALSDNQKGAISIGCSSIKNTLKSLERTDAAARSRVGSIYQIILSNYLTQMNLRLIKNGRLSTELTSILNEFSRYRTDFNAEYIIYTRSLEDLITSDCQSDPDNFYEKLTNVREERKKLNDITKNISETLDAHVIAIKNLRSSNILDNEKENKNV